MRMKSQNNILRFNKGKQGSHIWNYSYLNRGIIQYHIFWDIRGGQEANFWDDSWQQMPKIISQIYVQSSWIIARETCLTKIHQIRREAHNNEEFYESHPQEWWNQRFRADDT